MSGLTIYINSKTFPIFHGGMEERLLRKTPRKFIAAL